MSEKVYQYTYLFVRSDLSPQQQIIQAAHAIHGMEIASRTTKWPSSIVLIEAKNLGELEEIEMFLQEKQIQFYTFYESFFKEKTATATFPLQGEQRRCLANFPLYRG